MRVSVVIPTYNSGRLLVEAVTSVLAQTRLADEIIVVDDGSTDDTASLLVPFGAAVRYVRKENGGVSSARNRGVEEATGDWIGFLDSDDVWHPRKLEIQLAALARRPDLVLLGTRLYDWPGTHPALDQEVRGDLEEVAFERLIIRNCLVTSTILTRREVLQAAGPFDVTLSGPEDHDLWIRVAKLGRVANLRVALTGYRVGTPGSLSKNVDRMEAGMRAILEKLERDGVFHGRPLLRRKAWSHFRFSCGAMRYWAGEPRVAIRDLFYSLIGYPSVARPRLRLVRIKLLTAAVLACIRGTGRVWPEREARDGTVG